MSKLLTKQMSNIISEFNVLKGNNCTALKNNSTYKLIKLSYTIIN